MTAEYLKFLHHADVVDLNKVILRTRNQPVAVSIPFYLDYCFLVPMQSSEVLSTFRIPYFKV